MSQERIALLTYKNAPDLVDSEQLLPPAFSAVGIEALPVPWDGDVDWKDFSTIILRACWNYHLKREDFLGFLDKQVLGGKRIWNPLETVRWNTDKHYLLDLESRGVSIIPTIILEPGDSTRLPEILTMRGWEQGVVKPTVGASAFEVKKFTKENVIKVEKQLDRSRPWIVQKFCPEINSEGEYSLMFFNREYSHSVIKKPKDGDFRTQPHYGGTEYEIEPSQTVIDQVSQILSKVDGQLLYARIDGLLIDGKFSLMELELVEPYLFFASHPLAPQRFVEAFQKISR